MRRGQAVGWVLLVGLAQACGVSDAGSDQGAKAEDSNRPAGSHNGDGSKGTADGDKLVVNLHSLAADPEAMKRDRNQLVVKVYDWAKAGPALAKSRDLQNTGFLATKAVGDADCRSNSDGATLSCTVAVEGLALAELKDGVLARIGPDGSPSGASDARRWMSSYTVLRVDKEVKSSDASTPNTGSLGPKGTNTAETHAAVFSDAFSEALTALSGADDFSTFFASQGALVGVVCDGQANPQPLAGVSVAVGGGGAGKVVYPDNQLGLPSPAASATASNGLFVGFAAPDQTLAASALSIDASAAAGAPTYKLPSAFAAGSVIMHVVLTPENT